uniref:NAD-specific glutamate dehydrogenase n=1 Tax=Parastrongyloides trichosuri TaxID=131310 RepID=A0A0N5A0R1_PARTI
ELEAGRAAGRVRGALGHDAELGAAAPAGVGVEGVVVGAVDDDVLQVDVAAEDFDAVVRRVEGLNVFDGGARADAGQGQGLQLVAGRDFKARVADLDVTQTARVVVDVAAAVEGVGALDLAGAGDRGGQLAVGLGRATGDDDAAPLTLRGLSRRAFDVLTAGESDRLGSRAFGVDLRAAVHQQIVAAARCEDGHARLYRQDALRAGIGGGVDASVGAHGRAARDRIDGAGAQRHGQRAVDLLRQLAIAQRAVGHGADVGEAGRAVSRGLARARRARTAGVAAAAIAELAFAGRGHLGGAAAGRQGQGAGRRHEQGLEAAVHHRSTGWVK